MQSAKDEHSDEPDVPDASSGKYVIAHVIFAAVFLGAIVLLTNRLG